MENWEQCLVKVLRHQADLELEPKTDLAFASRQDLGRLAEGLTRNVRQPFDGGGVLTVKDVEELE